jgi:hypothetical protein
MVPEGPESDSPEERITEPPEPPGTRAFPAVRRILPADWLIGALVLPVPTFN